MPNDTKIRDVAVNYIRKNVGVENSKWPSTTIGALHPSLVDRLLLEDGELVLLSAFFSSESWYAFTTRRIVSQFRGALQSLDPSRGISNDFGNFKGYGLGAASHRHRPGTITHEVATITAVDSQAVVRFEFETWEASFLPIYAARYWDVKHPFLDKLMTTAEREDYKSRNG